MLSLERCREILGDDLTDADLEMLRDALYALADVVVSGFTEPVTPGMTPFRHALQLVPDSERFQLEERAAIHEYDGGLGRDQAERTALSEARLQPLYGK